jgi:hypothetical protein
MMVVINKQGDGEENRAVAAPCWPGAAAIDANEN